MMLLQQFLPAISDLCRVYLSAGQCHNGQGAGSNHLCCW